MAKGILKWLYCLWLIGECKTQTVTNNTDAPSTMTPVDQTTMPTTMPTTIPTTGSPHVSCYSCKYLSNLASCRHAKHCPDGSSCLSGQLTSGLYYLDCVPTPACMVLPAQLQASGTVTYLSDTFKKFECCTQSKCNRNSDFGVGR